MDFNISSAAVSFNTEDVCGYKAEWGTHDVVHPNGDVEHKLIFHIYSQPKPKFGELLKQAIKESKIPNKSECEFTQEMMSYDIIFFNVSSGTEQALKTMLLKQLSKLITEARTSG